MKQKAMTRLLALSTAAMIGLSGCGGSGAGAGGPALTPQESATTVGSITVGASSPTIGSDGATPIDINAAVKSANNVGMIGQNVVFSTTDSGSTLTVVNGTSDASGLATASLRISDATARSIQVNASSGGVQSSVIVSVAGTSVTVSGQTVLAFNDKSNYVVSVRNAGNVGVAGVPVTLRSVRGNKITESTAGSSTTDAAGQAKFQVSGLIAGADTLTATALGVSHSTDVSVSGDVASFDAPAAKSEAVVNTPIDVAVRFLTGGVPQANSAVQLTSTRGTLAATTGVTDAQGYFRTTLQSSQAGYATLSATSASGAATSTDFEFVSRVPSSMAVQASPTTISANPSGTSTNASELIARVRDSAGNPVKGVRVDFSSIADPSGGTISPAFAMTNSAGIASTAFIAGPNASGQNAVQVTAKVSGTAISATPALMTVVADALMVRMNTGNEIQVPDTTTYQLPWAVVVSDAAGNPVVGAKVTASYRPTRFRKGSYAPNGQTWTTAVEAQCYSEDGSANGLPDPNNEPNGVLDPGEDYDHDGVLEPGNVATIFVLSDGARTDASGFATLAIKYPRGFSNWVSIEFQVTITAPSGTEVRTKREINLPAEVGDMSANNTSPPGGVASPFGILPDCSNPN